MKQFRGSRGNDVSLLVYIHIHIDRYIVLGLIFLTSFSDLNVSPGGIARRFAPGCARNNLEKIICEDTKNNISFFWEGSFITYYTGSFGHRNITHKTKLQNKTPFFLVSFFLSKFVLKKNGVLFYVLFFFAFYKN